MRLLLFGATGTLGQRVLAEAVDRGHAVTAASRDPERIQEMPGVALCDGDVLDAESVARLAQGHDVILSAVGPGHAGDPCFLVEAARSLVAAAERAGVRVVVLGGAGILEASPGVVLVETSDFAATWMGVALAHRDALALYRAAPPGVDWTYVSPAATVELGKRTGRYRTISDQFVENEEGGYQISAQDLAVAILDETEQPRHSRQRFTVAY